MNTRLRHGTVCVAVLVMAIASATSWADPPSLVGRLSLVEGTVSFRPGTMDDWAPAVLNYPLTEGDEVWTEQDGRVEIQIGSSAVRLGPGSDFTFVALDDQTTQVRLSSGSINVRLRMLDPGGIFEIDTPNAVVTLDVAGSYRVDVQEDGEGTVVVARQGESQVTAGTGAFSVASGQEGTVSGSGSIAYYVQEAASPDAFDAWCISRDASENVLRSVRYVSREVIGIEDLDAYGAWITVPVYGTVWQPTRVAAGWAPYRFGRWAWIEPWGWTWIDSAPWGFAPFHYGRWANVTGRWVWVPGPIAARPVYAPALVVFVGGDAWRPSGGEGIGWFPLGPREPYIPPFTSSTRYLQGVNLGTTIIITDDSLRRFDVEHYRWVNRNVPRAVTVVPRQAFITSRPVEGAALTVPPTEVTRAPVMGMAAALVPQRESVYVAPQEQRGPAPRPSEMIINRSVYTGRTPPAAPVPFESRQQELSAHPGRPVDQSALPGLRAENATRRPPMRTFGAPRQEEQSPQRQQRQQEQVPQRQPAQQQQAQPQQAVPQRQQPQQTVPQRQQPQTQQEQVPQRQPTQQQQAQPQQTVPQRQQPQTQQEQQKPQQEQPQQQRQGTGQANDLIKTLRAQSLPSAEQHLASLRGKKGINLDYNAIQRQIQTARSLLSGADSDVAQGRSDQAMQKAQSAQQQIAQIEATLSAAESSGGGD